MPEPVTFYFEFASPYSYLASHRIEEVVAKHGRQVLWRPIRLLEVWEAIGQDVAAIPKAKLQYIEHDSNRCAQQLGIPFTMPEVFPPDATLARSAFYHVDSRDPPLAKTFAQAVANQYYGEGRDISTPAQLRGLAARLGIDADELDAAGRDEAAAARVIAATAEAAGLGCFGVPWMRVEGENFFGHDRLPYLDQWLAARAAEGADAPGTA